jgi:DNA-binding CsgD family transcriptional regulator/tetratricopeptide (TPR) repeat protein
MHAAILASLRSAGSSDDARMAFHADAAGDGPAVLQHAPRAARQAAELGSHREAAAQFGRALRFAAGAEPREAAPLHAGLGTELLLAGQFQDAVGAFEQALARWRDAGDRPQEGDTLRNLACALEPLGRGAEAVAAAEEAVAILEPLGPSTELARAYSGLAASRMVNSAHEAAIGLAVQAAAIAENLGAPDVLSDALNTQGCSMASTGGDWEGYLRRALSVALSAGLDDQAGRAYGNLYSVSIEQWRFAAAERYFTDGVAFCDEHDVGAHAAFLRSERLVALERTGRWDEAVELGSALLSSAGRSPAARLRLVHVLGLLRSRRGEPGAWAYLDEAAAAAEATGEPQWIVPVRLARAEAHWLQGEPQLAAREAELADDAAAGADQWERGQVGAWLRRTGSSRPPRGNPDDLAPPYRYLLAGDAAAAARLWADLGCPYEAALGLQDADQENMLREALSMVDDLGAPATARAIRQKMRRIGIRSVPAGPRAATRHHPLGLTRREQEVLDLICAGFSNAEIAAKLFISARTVDHHVSSVLAKLGAPTRGAAVAQATRLGLARELGSQRPGQSSASMPP